MKAPVIFLALIALSEIGNAQHEKSLNRTIVEMDSIFFSAFNKCDTTTTKQLFTKDLEFYHDRGGVTGYEQNIASVRYRCSQEYKVRRELVAGTTEVFPIKDFGAIQLGSHRFYYTPKNGKEQLDGTFRFVHIWKNEGGTWKISRVVSFDH